MGALLGPMLASLLGVAQGRTRPVWPIALALTAAALLLLSAFAFAAVGFYLALAPWAGPPAAAALVALALLLLAVLILLTVLLLQRRPAPPAEDQSALLQSLLARVGDRPGRLTALAVAAVVLGVAAGLSPGLRRVLLALVAQLAEETTRK